MNKFTSLLAAAGLLGFAAAGSFTGTAHAAVTTGGPSTAALSAGSLAITGATPGSFSGTVGLDQRLYSTLAAYTATDATGTGSGWHLTIQATQFATTGGTVRTLAVGSLFMAAPTVACNANTTACTGTEARPTVTPTGQAVALDNGSVALASAAVNTGMGSYDFSTTDITGHTGNQLYLVVPAGAYAGTYTSTLTVSIITAP